MALSGISLTLGRCTARCECAGHIVAERMLKQPVYRFSSQGGSGRFGTEPAGMALSGISLSVAAAPLAVEV